MEQDFANLLILTISPHKEEVEPHLEKVSEITKIDQYTLRQRLQGKGTAILRRERDKAGLEQTARELSSAGYSSLVFTDPEFRSLPPARRAVAVKISDGRMDFFDSRGEGVGSISSADECALVIGNLNPESLSARQLQERLRAGEEEVLGAVARGAPVLDILPRGRQSRIRVFGKNFNYASMGDRAGLSAVQNVLGLVESVRSAAARVRLDASFGLGSRPAIGGISLSVREMPDLDPPRQERLKQFENHSRAALMAFAAGLAPVKVPAREKPGPEVSPAAPKIPPVIGRPHSRLERFMTRVRHFGPPAVFLPLLVVALALGAVFWATKDFRFLAPAGGGWGLLFFLHGFVCLRRTRRIENVPTSKVRSLPMGSVEVAGRAGSDVILKTPYSAVDSVWYRYEVQEYRQQYDSEYGRRGGYVTVASGCTEDIPFYVEDETGKILVNPRGAVVEVSCRQVTHQRVPGAGRSSAFSPREGTTRIIETFIPWNYPVYVMGVAQHEKKEGNPERAEYLRRLRELKKSPERLARFDRDQDGKIDEAEWEQARAAVQRELLEEKLRSPQAEELVFIGKGEEGELFMISDRSERELLRSLKIRTALAIFGGGGIILAAVSWGIKMATI